MHYIEFPKLGIVFNVEGLRLIQRKYVERDGERICNHIRLFFDGVTTLEFHLSSPDKPDGLHSFAYVLSQEEFENLDEHLTYWLSGKIFGSINHIVEVANENPPVKG